MDDSYHDFFFFPSERGPNAHTTSRVCSDDGIMLYNLIDQNAVGCWHTSTPYTPQNHGTVDRDDEGLIFPADVKIDENRNVWVISDRMSNFLISNLDYNDVNFRIYTAPLSTLVSGTNCDLSNRISGRFGLNSILSSKPNTNLFTNVGLGAFKSLNTNPLASPQSLQNLQSINQPLNAQALQVPLQPISQISQQSPIAKISQVQPLISYEVREPHSIPAQSYSTKTLPTIYSTKTAPQNTYYKTSSIFGTSQSQSTADFTTSIQSLPKSGAWWTTQLW